MSVIHFAGDAWFARVDEGTGREDILRIAAALGEAASERHPGARVYVGFDTRTISRLLAREAAQIIAAYDLEVILSETYCPTSALCQATKNDERAVCALMLTADSRSADYLGVRVRMADGSPASSDDTEILESLIKPDVITARGDIVRRDIMTPHLDHLSACVNEDVIRASRPLVICDPMFGATTTHAARLLGALGARVIELHHTPDSEMGGLHPEAAEPWIDECERAVIDYHAQFGVALDGAGDRVAFIDETGRALTPHILLALIMEYLVRVRDMTGRVVVPIFVSTQVRRQAKRLGLPLTVTPAGYIWMREEMNVGDVLCAGDALGGICIPICDCERDSLAVAAIMCEIVAMDTRPLSHIVKDLDATLGHMQYGYRNVRMGSGAVQVLRNALPGINPATIANMTPTEVSHPGGLHVRFSDGSWLLLRPSRSYSIARIYAEAPTRALRDELLSAGSKLALSPLSPME